MVDELKKPQPAPEPPYGDSVPATPKPSYDTPVPTNPAPVPAAPFGSAPAAPPVPVSPYEQPAYAPPVYAQPAYASNPVAQPQVGAPVVAELSGGMKFAWLAIGLFLGIPGIIIAWVTNMDKHQNIRSSAMKFALIGFLINLALIVLTVIMSVALFTLLADTIVRVSNEFGLGYHW